MKGKNPALDGVNHRLGTTEEGVTNLNRDEKGQVIPSE